MLCAEQVCFIRKQVPLFIYILKIIIVVHCTKMEFHPCNN